MLSFIIIVLVLSSLFRRPRYWGFPFLGGWGHLCKKTCITVTRNASLAFSLEPDALASADGLHPRSRVWLLPCYDDSVSDFPDI